MDAYIIEILKILSELNNKDVKDGCYYLGQEQDYSSGELENEELQYFSEDFYDHEVIDGISYAEFKGEMAMGEKTKINKILGDFDLKYVFQFFSNNSTEFKIININENYEISLVTIKGSFDILIPFKKVEDYEEEDYKTVLESLKYIINK